MRWQHSRQRLREMRVGECYCLLHEEIFCLVPRHHRLNLTLNLFQQIKVKGGKEHGQVESRSLSKFAYTQCSKFPSWVICACLCFFEQLRSTNGWFLKEHCVMLFRVKCFLEQIFLNPPLCVCTVATNVSCFHKIKNPPFSAQYIFLMLKLFLILFKFYTTLSLFKTHNKSNPIFPLKRFLDWSIVQQLHLYVSFCCKTVHFGNQQVDV